MNRRVLILFSVLAVAAFFTVRGASPNRHRIHASRHQLARQAHQAPFSNAILAGDTLYLAGSVGLDPKTGRRRRKSRMKSSSCSMLQNYARRCRHDHGRSRLRAGFCTDLAYYDKFNAAYKTYFTKDFPARAFIGAGSLLRSGHSNASHRRAPLSPPPVTCPSVRSYSSMGREYHLFKNDLKWAYINGYITSFAI